MATAPPALPSAQNPNKGFEVDISVGLHDANQVPADAGLPNATNTTTQANIRGNLTATDEIVPQPNILDRFASYTYSASVYLMSTLQYKQLLRSKKKNINGYFLLFQSGGAPTNKSGGFLGNLSGIGANGEKLGEVYIDSTDPDFGRNPAFPQDFYIDSITIDNVLPGKLTQSPHMVTDLKFTVVEPGNITLLDRIHKAVQDMGQVSEINQPINYTAAAYLMVIRWYGYDINGNQVQVGALDPATGLTDPNAVVEKFIPFLIKGIEWQVSSKLVTYDFSCAPISQWISGGTRRGTLTYDAEFSATTVSELLGNNLQYVSATAPADKPGATTTTGGKGGVFANPNYSQSAVNGSAATPAPPKASSAPTSSLIIKQGVMGAMNAKQQELVKSGIYEVADTYAIEFGTHPDFPNDNIGAATLRLPGNVVTQSNVAMSPSKSQDPNGALNPNSNPMNINTRKWSVPSGMQLVQIIDQAVRKSSFISNQQLTVIDAQTGEDVKSQNISKKTMLWFEITMEAAQGKYDRKRNDYAYDIKFIVTPYPLQSFDSKFFPLTQFRGLHKSYPYWFTGQNTAVLDYTATFNHLYNITVTGTEPNNSQAARQRELSTASMREIPFYTYAPSSTQDRKGEESRALEAQANAAEYLYSPGDQGEGKIRIIGDPAWIQQGSLSGGVNVKEFSYSPFLPDGTINFDAQQVMFEIAWQRPKDYDLNTGLADPYSGGNTKDRLPIQSVVYKANRVVSEFRQGQFEQTIEGSLYMFPKPNGTNTVGRTSASNVALSKDQTNESNAEAARLSRQNAQTPAAIEAVNFNSSLNNSVLNSSAFGKTGTLPAPVTQLTNVSGSTSPSAALNGNYSVGPSAYPRVPTGSGVNPITFSENSPQPLNTNPFANAGRTQTIVRES